MVNIHSAAESAVKAYSAAIALGANYSYPLPKLASHVSTFFMPNYTSYSLGEINLSPNQSVVASDFESIYSEWRSNGQPGTVIQIIHHKIQPVSNSSAICWLKYHIDPQNGLPEWEWTNVYGFRRTEEKFTNGLYGGWEFAVEDNEHLQYASHVH